MHFADPGLDFTGERMSKRWFVLDSERAILQHSGENRMLREYAHDGRQENLPAIWLEAAFLADRLNFNLVLRRVRVEFCHAASASAQMTSAIWKIRMSAGCAVLLPCNPPLLQEKPGCLSWKPGFLGRSAEGLYNVRQMCRRYLKQFFCKTIYNRGKGGR